MILRPQFDFMNGGADFVIGAKVRFVKQAQRVPMRELETRRLENSKIK